MSGYTSACELASTLGLTAALKTLTATLKEETATDAKLAKASGPAIAKAGKAEKAAKAAKKPDAMEEVGKVIGNVVKKITG